MGNVSHLRRVNTYPLRSMADVSGTSGLLCFLLGSFIDTGQSVRRVAACDEQGMAVGEFWKLQAIEHSTLATEQAINEERSQSVVVPVDVPSAVCRDKQEQERRIEHVADTLHEMKAGRFVSPPQCPDFNYLRNVPPELIRYVSSYNSDFLSKSIRLSNESENEMRSPRVRLESREDVHHVD